MKNTNFEKQKIALKELGVGKFVIKPCRNFNPDCGNCKLYILEGLLEWYADVLHPTGESTNPAKKRG